MFIPKLFHRIFLSKSLWKISVFFIVFRIRVPYPFQWGSPSFNAGDAFAMGAASLVALIEVWSNDWFVTTCTLRFLIASWTIWSKWELINFFKLLVGSSFCSSNIPHTLIKIDLLSMPSWMHLKAINYNTS